MAVPLRAAPAGGLARRMPAAVVRRPSRAVVLVRASAGPVAAAAASPQQPPQQWRLAASVCRIWQSHAARVRAQVDEGKGLAQQLRQQCSAMGVAVLPFASIVKASSSTQAEIYFGLAKALDIYLAILTVRVLLSWFRNIDWFSEPWNTLRQLTDPFLSVFRGIIPAVGGIDLSPMLGFFLLNFGRNMLMQWAM